MAQHAHQNQTAHPILASWPPTQTQIQIPLKVVLKVVLLKVVLLLLTQLVLRYPQVYRYRHNTVNP